jgi:hypothetical protein
MSGCKSPRSSGFGCFGISGCKSPKSFGFFRGSPSGCKSPSCSCLRFGIFFAKFSFSIASVLIGFYGYMLKNPCCI